MNHVLLATALDTDFVTHHEAAIKRILQDASANIVQIVVGVWVFKMPSGFEAMQDLIQLLKSQDVPFVAVPIGENPLTVGASKDEISALEKAGVPVLAYTKNYVKS